jgi:hypothetical protein
VFLECPGDLEVPAFTTVETLQLDGFTITNTDLATHTIQYQCMSEGLAMLSDNGNPASLYGFTPDLSSGESFTPPSAVLLIPEIRNYAIEEVMYETTILGLQQHNFCTTTIQFFPPVATLITKFDVRALKSGAELKWEISSNDDILGYNLYRRSSRRDALFNKLNEELIAADKATFLDRTAEPGSSYEYRFGVALANGNEIPSQTVSVQTVVLSLALYQNQPNPFNPTTKITFSLPEAMNAHLTIFDVEGRLVKTLVDQPLASGFKEYVWDATDHDGTPVSSGMYFYRLDTNKGTLTKKMLLLR